MDSGHSAMFAALSVLNIPAKSWKCNVVDGVRHSTKTDPITAFTGTDVETVAFAGFNGPYTMKFTVTDNGSPLTVIGTVTLNGTCTLTDGSGNVLALPSNHNMQIDPGIDGNGSSQVWYRWNNGTTLRELRFETSLNLAAVIAELAKLNLGWLGKLLPAVL